ncbi:MAG: phage baseplate assembly protein [Baekduiaceae bacterium]
MTTHNVALRIGGAVVEGWESYDVDTDMLQPADNFSLQLFGAAPGVFDLCAPDSEVQILVDDAPLITGFIDKRAWGVDRQAGTMIDVEGRDKAGRLVDESCELFLFRGLGLRELALKVCDPWFTAVSLSNARNRTLLRGPGATRARAIREPTIEQTARAAVKVNPGESRWQVLQHFLEEADVLAWSTGDGKEIVIGRPNYEQAPQYRFVLPSTDSDHPGEGNVISARLDDSVASRYSAIIAVGTGQGNARDYAAAVTKRRGIARDGSGPHGTGGSFQHRKVLIVSDDDVRTAELAERRALREQQQRDATGRQLELVVQGHGQEYGGRHALFAFDTIAEVDLQPLGIRGDWLITACKFSRSRSSGTRTTLQLVPSGTHLSL